MSTVKLMVIGPGCSVAAEPIAEASHYWNIIQVENCNLCLVQGINRVCDFCV